MVTKSNLSYEFAYGDEFTSVWIGVGGGWGSGVILWPAATHVKKEMLKVFWLCGTKNSKLEQTTKTRNKISPK